MIAGRKDNCQNPLGQSDEVPSMTDSSFGIEQKAAAPFAETSQLIAPPADDAGRRFSPLDRLAQVGAAGKAIELLRPERERVRLGGLETDQEADRRGCGVVGCAIGSAEPHTHQGGVRVLPISRPMRLEYPTTSATRIAASRSWALWTPPPLMPISACDHAC